MKTGILFRSIQWKNSPFKSRIVRKAYETLVVKGKDIYFSTFDELEGKILKRCWRFSCKWEIIEDKTRIDIIFDRSSTKEHEINRKKKIPLKIVNDPELSAICWDKIKTYRKFPGLVPKSFLIKDNKEAKDAVDKIRSEKIVLKPRYGIKGEDVAVCLKKDIPDISKEMIIQEFIDSSRGHDKLDIKGVHDLRVILINGKIDHAYARISENSFLTNVFQGGKKVFLDIENLPSGVFEVVNKIDSGFKEFNPRIYSIDMAFDRDQKIHVLELESNTGFAYYEKKEKIRDRFLSRMIKFIN